MFIFQCTHCYVHKCHKQTETLHKHISTWFASVFSSLFQWSEFVTDLRHPHVSDTSIQQDGTIFRFSTIYLDRLSQFAVQRWRRSMCPKVMHSRKVGNPTSSHRDWPNSDFSSLCLQDEFSRYLRVHTKIKDERERILWITHLIDSRVSPTNAKLSVFDANILKKKKNGRVPINCMYTFFTSSKPQGWHGVSP